MLTSSFTSSFLVSFQVVKNMAKEKIATNTKSDCFGY